MVLPLAAAAGKAAEVAATGLGLGMGKSDLDLTRDLFKLQMQQAKRLWTADWAENAIRHGEQCMQSAQQHAESQALALAQYYQSEKINSQAFKLARDQDSRSYEMAWRAEVRESLRDELTNQNSRFNIIMLCDTVCLGCVFGLVAGANPPVETSRTMIHLYVASLGITILLFTISLWCAVIVVRRLLEHTASILERKLFAQSDDLQKVWQQQLSQKLPTGPQEILLFNQAYEKWLAEHIDPLGTASIHLMSYGVVTMFIAAGLLVHNQYLIEYNSTPSNPIYAPAIFWSAVGITCVTVIYMKVSEDRHEKKKLGIYDNSWQDKPALMETGPFAKIIQAAKDLFSTTAVALSSTERVESLHRQEQVELKSIVSTSILQQQVAALKNESITRGAKTRKTVMQLLTTASEELDALPEELTSRLNKLMHDIDEVECRTAQLINTIQLQQDQSNKNFNDSSNNSNHLNREGSHADWLRLSRMPLSNRTIVEVERKPMPPHPMDAQRIPISLVSLRQKLGQIPLTSLLRIKNLSDDPIRLKSGVQLKEGKYIKSLLANEPQNNNTCHYHLYPGTEIPPRTEVVIAARSAGNSWIPTSGIAGELLYSNKQETWMFKITFSSSLVSNLRRCKVQAYPQQVHEDQDNVHNYNNSSDNANNLSDNNQDNHNSLKNLCKEEQYWQISKDEVDRKVNNEIVISIDLLRGEEASKAAWNMQQSEIIVKSGYLRKNKVNVGLGLQWEQLWFLLTPAELVYSATTASKYKTKIALSNISSIGIGSDRVKNNVLEIHMKTPLDGSCCLKLSASSQQDRDDWIQTISKIAGLKTSIPSKNHNNNNKSTSSSEGVGYLVQNSESLSFKGGIECVHNSDSTEILPI